MGQETHIVIIGSELFDAIGKYLPLAEIGKINAEAHQEAQKLLPNTSGTSEHLNIAIGYKLALIRKYNNDN